MSRTPCTKDDIITFTVDVLSLSVSQNLAFHENQIHKTSSDLASLLDRVARLGEKAPVGLLLAAVGSLKFGFGTLLLFGLLFESLTTTLDDLRQVLA